MLALRSLSRRSGSLLHRPLQQSGKVQSAGVARRLLSNPSSPKELASTGIRPPRVVRSLLVGSAVGLATPFYVIVGIGRIWTGYLPKSTAGQFIKFITGSLIGGGSFVLITNYAMPFMKNNSDIVLPFAVSNGISAAFWYTIMESIFGLKKMMQPITTNIAGLSFSSYIRTLPFAGASVGLLTAITTPLLWPLMFDTFWSEDLRNVIVGIPDSNNKKSFYDVSNNWLVDMYAQVAMPVVVPVALFSGSIMHLVLKPVVVGIQGRPWTRTSAPVLASIMVLASSYFYFFKTDWFWEERVDMSTGETISSNFKSQSVLHDGGRKAREVCESRETAQALATIRHLWNWFVDLAIDYDDEKDKNRDDKMDEAISSYKLGYERSRLLPLVDRLIRLQHLDNEMSSLSDKDDEKIRTLQKQKEALLLDAKESHMASDLSEVLTNTKLLMMLQHTSKDKDNNGGNNKNANDTKKSLQSLNIRQVTADSSKWSARNDNYKQEKREKKHFFKTMRKKINKDASQAVGAKRMQVLNANIDLFQQELQQKLGYDIEKDNALRADLNKFQRGESNSKIMQYVLSWSIVGAGLALTLFNMRA